MFPHVESSYLHGILQEIDAKFVALREDLRTLSDKFNHQVLITQSLRELLCEHTNLTHEQVLEKMREIDLRDGIADGKIGVHAFLCERCGHQVAAVHPRCIYCGAERSAPA